MSRPACLVAMHAHPESLKILLGTEDAEVPVTIGLQPATAHALRHLHALHAHADGCQASPPIALFVDLHIRALGCLGGRPTCVLVRPGCPAFWLRVAGSPGTRELHPDVLDATCLLLARRVAVELVDHPETAWDEAADSRPGAMTLVPAAHAILATAARRPSTRPATPLPAAQARPRRRSASV